MKQTFTSSFEWRASHANTAGEAVGNHVEVWQPGLSILSLQNFLLAGVGGSLEDVSAAAFRSLRGRLNPLAWPLDNSQVLYDCGDLLDCPDTELRDTIIAALIQQAFDRDVCPIVMSANVQAGYGVFAGASLHTLTSSTSLFPGYIRMSPVLLTSFAEASKPSVGSLMYGLTKRFNRPFNALQLGVQEAINPKSAWVDASALGIQVLTLAACDPELLLLYMRNFCKDLDGIVLSLDLDVLSEAHAPGAHRSTSFGLCTEVLLPAVRWLAGEGKLVAVELTGVGVEKPVHDRRPRLAASLIQDLLSHWF